MFLHKLAYRHAGGEVEGFVGNGFTKSDARADAVRRVCREMGCKGLPYDPARLVESDKGLTPAEKESVRSDWKISERTGK